MTEDIKASLGVTIGFFHGLLLYAKTNYCARRSLFEPWNRSFRQENHARSLVDWLYEVSLGFWRHAKRPRYECAKV